MRYIKTEIESYLRNRLGLSEGNVVRIMRMIGTLIHEYHITVPSQAALDTIKDECRKRGNSPETTRLYMWALKYWGMSYGIEIQFNKCPLPKGEKKIKTGVPFDVVRRLLNANDMTPRDKALIAVLSCGGGRISEYVVNVMTKSGGINVKTDIDAEHHELILRKTKTRKERRVPLPPEAWRLLQEYMGKRADDLATIGLESNYLFVTNAGKPFTDDVARKMLSRYKKKHGIEGPLNPHAFRHACAKKMLQTPGISPYDVMHTLGHSDLRTTMIYLEDDIEHRRKVSQGLTY